MDYINEVGEDTSMGYLKKLMPPKARTDKELFHIEMKHIAVRDNPGADEMELRAITQNMYKALAEEDQKKYVVAAEKEFLELMRGMRVLLNYQDQLESNKAKGLPPKMPTPLQLYTDAFMPKSFMSEMRASVANSLCADSYRKMSGSQRMKWIQMALEAKPSYDEKLAQFEVDHPEVDLSAKTASLLTEDEVKIKDMYIGKPEKPPISGYLLYAKELFSSDLLMGLENQERALKISRMWKELGEKEQTKFDERALELNDQYRLKYASYLENLTEDQRNEVLLDFLTKGKKRSNAKNLHDKGESKKPKKDEMLD